MNKIIKPEDAKPIWDRSATWMAGILLAFAKIAPETPWWGFLILACVVLVAQQIVFPSKSV